MNTQIVYVLLSFLPAGIVTGLMELWRRFSHPDGRNLPIKDRLLRPPGETCRRKIEQLNDKIDEIAIWVLGFPSTLLVCYMAIANTSAAGPVIPGVWISAFAIAAIVFVALTWKLCALVKERNNWRLNFSGERAVGEQLNQLMFDGCRVFHDFSLPEGGHIDHVVVGRSGIYAVQTLAERKRNASASQQAHEVIYDGNALEFPFRKCGGDITQAREQAARLAKFLSAATKESLPVKSIVALPGWYVIYRGSGDVIVVNPKMIDSAILTHEAPILAPERIQKIAAVLDQKCRDVEF